MKIRQKGHWYNLRRKIISFSIMILVISISWRANLNVWKLHADWCMVPPPPFHRFLIFYLRKFKGFPLSWLNFHPLKNILINITHSLFLSLIPQNEAFNLIYIVSNFSPDIHILAFFSFLLRTSLLLSVRFLKTPFFVCVWNLNLSFIHIQNPFLFF